MPMPPLYFPVYQFHFRLPEPGLHANPLLQTPPVPHVEGLHTLQWIKPDTNKFTTTVKGDGQLFALRNHDSGAFIPHIATAPPVGPFLVDTLQHSKYQVIFHQPNVELDGGAIGIFQWVIAPPWRCMELKLPLPKFMAKLGRAGAARKAEKAAAAVAGKQASALAALAGPVKAKLAAAAKLEKELDDAHKAYREFEKQAKLADAAEKKLGIADRRVDQQAEEYSNASALVDAEARARDARDDEKQALENKAAADTLARRGRQAADEHEVRARTEEAHARTVAGEPRKAALERAEQHRVEAEKQRSGAAAWRARSSDYSKEAGEHRERASAARKEQAAYQKEAQDSEEGKLRNKAQGRDKGLTDSQNPYVTGGGAGNANVPFPSLFAHLPLPHTVEIYASVAQILKAWGAAILNSVGEMLNAYVGFIFDGILSPGASAGTAWLLTLGKSAASGLINTAQTYLMEDEVAFKIDTKLGPAKISAKLEQNQKTGKWTWKASAEDSSKRVTVDPLSLSASDEGAVLSVDDISAGVNKKKVSVWKRQPPPPVTYGGTAPVVNAPPASAPSATTPSGNGPLR
jgi:hypothetical protein